ncbi:pleckstrin homology domain-containing family B member 2-like isoform X2 [Papio anubis]|nr:pleckstrin homology domain-containing family B member 2-like isoform X2 [Papio anubis]
MAFVKSGWLLRQSTILKRWKKNWFDLWSDGHLIYYDDQTRQNIEDKVHMPVDCINIRTGQECRDIQPPDGKSKDCMLQIVCRDGKTISLCAESTDDCLRVPFTLSSEESGLPLHTTPNEK